ncbi:MAG: hypothetical protein AAGA06_02215 [Pseudomonadota bacterium]
MAPKPKYFRQFHTHWEPTEVLPEGSRDPELVALGQEIENTCRERTLALTVQVSRDLYAKRRTLPSDTSWITTFGISFASDPKPGFDVHMGTSIWADVLFDPRDFLTLPDSPEVIGERLIAATEEGVSKLEAFPDFPADLIRSSCETFRGNNYVTHYGTKKGRIEGTPLKTRLDVFVDPLTTRRDLCVLYRGKPLLSTTVTHFDQVDWTLALSLNSVELKGQTLTYRPVSQDHLDWWHKVSPKTGLHPLFQPVDVDLTEFQSAYVQMRDKGWVTL